MGYELYWTEEQLETFERKLGAQVVERLAAALERKQTQIIAADNPAELNRRFYRTFSLDGLKVAEIPFTVHGKSFRAVCPVYHDEKTVFLWTVVDKETSEQGRVLQLMRGQSERIDTFIRKHIL